MRAQAEAVAVIDRHLGGDTSKRQAVGLDTRALQI